MATIHLRPGDRNLPSQMVINDQATHRGGEGNIYFTTDGQYAVKIYHAPPSDKQSMLEKILELGKNLGEDEQFLCLLSAVALAVFLLQVSLPGMPGQRPTGCAT